ncbi:MAG: thiopurine S-methyltransferase [Pseudomonadota bacterium]|nr:thiopurine S-methyltransferase [Pseudomonadota bacterium]
MQAAFWLERWQNQETGFHQSSTHPWLVEFFQHLSDDPSNQNRPSKVFVPLCGKSLDMVWLAGQGCSVVGVELAESAVQAFFAEQQLSADLHTADQLTAYQHDPFTLWQGDFFALNPAHLAGASCFYDRAALVALPPSMRQAYVAHLSQLLPAQARGLLITFDYDQNTVEGPPFAVPEAELKQLYAGWYLTHLASRELISDSPKFSAQGLQSFVEHCWLLQRDTFSHK